MGDWITISKLLPQFVYPTKFVLWLLLLAFVLLLFRRRTGAGISLLATRFDHDMSTLGVPDTQTIKGRLGHFPRMDGLS